MRSSKAPCCSQKSRTFLNVQLQTFGMGTISSSASSPFEAATEGYVRASCCGKAWTCAMVSEARAM